MKTILLGASNSWFPITLSALSIPTTSNQLIQTVEKYWTALGKAPNQETLETLIEVFQATNQFRELLQELSKHSIEKIWQIIENKQHQTDTELAAIRDLKTPEWLVFSEANPNLNTPDFQLKSVSPPTGYEKYIENWENR